MALLGTVVLVDVRTLNGDNWTWQNNGSPVASAVVVGEDEEGGTVNLRVLLDGANQVYAQNVPAENVEAVRAVTTTK